MKQRQNDPGAPSTLPCAPVSAAAPRPTAHTGRYAVSFQRSADDTPSSWSTTARPPPATGAKAADMAWIYFLQDVWQAGSVRQGCMHFLRASKVPVRRPFFRMGSAARWLGVYAIGEKALRAGTSRAPSFETAGSGAQKRRSTKPQATKNQRRRWPRRRTVPCLAAGQMKVLYNEWRTTLFI